MKKVYIKICHVESFNMSTSFVDLSGFSLGDLLTLREEINAKVALYVEKAKVADILKDVAEQGFSCQPGRDYEITGLKRIELPYYFYVYTYQKNQENVEDVHVSDRDYRQKDWVAYLNFEYQPRDEDDFEIVSIWDWDDQELLAIAAAKMMIPVYYREMQSPLPDKFIVIFQEGDAYIGHVDNNEIHLNNGDVIASIDKTSNNNHDLFIVPQYL